MLKNFSFLFLTIVLFTACNSQNINSLKPLDAELTTVTYPFPVSYKTAQNQEQQLKMAYMDVHPEKGKENGQTIVLLHGKNFNGYYFEETARALVQEGFRVVIPDQIGFGKSSKPKHYQFSFHQLAANTLSLLEGLGIHKFTVLGHSMGGMLASRMAVMYPKRVRL